MNEQIKKRFYKRWWFAFVLGIVVGVPVSIGILFLMAYPKYLTPKYWVGRMSGDYAASRVSSDGMNDLSRPTATTTPAYFEIREPDGKGGWLPTVLDSRYLSSANIGFDQTTLAPYVSIVFEGQGGQLLSDITGRNIGKGLGLFVDGKIVEAPTVASRISGGSLILSGKFSLQDIKLLAQRLNAGKGLTQGGQ
jgi:preprotein translocase subunit SecD